MPWFHQRPNLLTMYGEVSLDPSTTQYSFTQSEGGFHSYVNFTLDVNRVYGIANFGFWSGKITGTEAKMFGRDFNGLFNVSVDGGAWVDATNISGLHTLFTGLADTEHDVTVRIDAIFGETNGYWDKSQAYFMEATGASPSLSTLGNYATSFDTSKLVTSGEHTAIGAAGYDASYKPSINPVAQNASTLNVRFNTAATEILIAAGTVNVAAPSVFVSVDGGAPTEYATTNGIARVSGLSGTHDYNVWSSGSTARGCDICGVNANAAITNSANEYRIDQFGDSITEGVVLAPNGYVDTHSVASNFSRLGQTYAVAGWTINQLLTDINNFGISDIIDTSGDVAILAIGRNNVAGGIDPTEASEYGDIITALLALGYSKILCRGILPEISNDYAAENAVLEGVATGFANSKVIWIDTIGWTAIDTQDGVHPTIAGYVQIANYAKIDYAAALVD